MTFYLFTHKNFFNKDHWQTKKIEATIKITHELKPNNSLPFLDVLLIRNNGKLKFKIYCKPTCKNDQVHLLYNHEQLYIHICMQKNIQHNKDKQTQFFRKIYLSLYWKDCVWEVSWRLNRTATYWPPLFWLSQPFFPILLGCSTRGLGSSLCWDIVLIPASSLQLIWTSCRRGYIIIWHPPTSCEHHNSHSIQPLNNQGSPLISSTGCTCYLHRCISSFDSLAGVNM